MIALSLDVSMNVRAWQTLDHPGPRFEAPGPETGQLAGTRIRDPRDAHQRPQEPVGYIYIYSVYIYIYAYV